MNSTLSSHADPESVRLQLLRDYAILDTPPEAVFDRIVAAAAAVFGAPMSTVTIIAEDRCWFKARHGVALPEMPRAQSLCGYAFRSSGTFILTDARRDERLGQTPLVADAGVRFYIAVPLMMPEGCSLGTLCVLDRIPRQPMPEQVRRLEALAAEAVAALIARRPASPSAPAAVGPPRRTVLIVDDEESVRTLLRVLIERREAETILASNGHEALTQLRAHGDKIGAILTDIHMPEMTGLEFIRALRGHPDKPPIVVMTGRADETLLAQLAEEKVACILHKPFAMAEVEAVLALLPARR